MKENNDEINGEIKKIISEIKCFNGDIHIDGNEKIISDLQFDSIDVMTLIIAIEERFNICFAGEMLLIQNFDTVQSLTELIKRLVEEKNEKNFE